MLKSLRHALRLLLKSPGFTLVSVCSLAIGIGATSAMFSFADALILRPLPVLEPARIAAVTTSSSTAFANTALSYPDYRDYRDGNRTFDGLMAASFASFGFKPDAAALPKVTTGMYVSGNIFRVLGVQPALGRGFLESEDQAVGRDAVVVLGHDYWVSQFNANPSAVGSTIWINSVPLTIIGVLPEQFTGIDQYVKPSMFVPLAMSPRLSGENILEKRDVRWLTVKGRLKPGVGIAQAAADLTGIGTRLEQMYPQSNRNQHVDVQTEFQLRVRQSPPNAALVAMLLMLAFCVLLVACANVTGLLLSRARARSREMAVRLAIGAARGALIRQLLLENLILAIAGGLAGIAVAYLGTSFFNSIPIPTDVPLAFHVSVDRRMLPPPDPNAGDLRILADGRTIDLVPLGQVPVSLSSRDELQEPNHGDSITHAYKVDLPTLRFVAASRTLAIRLPREAFDTPFALWHDGRPDLARFVVAQGELRR